MFGVGEEVKTLSTYQRNDDQVLILLLEKFSVKGHLHRGVEPGNV